MSKSKEVIAINSELTTAPGSPLRGFEHEEDSNDIIMPRVFLLQAGSPLVKEGDFVAGEIVNSMNQERLGDTFVPIFYWKEFAKFNPKDRDKRNFDPAFEPGEIIWRTRDHNDPRVLSECSFGPNSEKPTAVTFFNFLCLFEGTDYPLVLSFSKTSYGAGKKLFSLAKFANEDMFNRKYEIGTKLKTNEHGSFFVLDVTPAGSSSNDMRTKAEGLWESLADKKADIQADVDNE